MNPVSTHSLRPVAAVLAALGFIVASLAGTAPAWAQTVSCDRVPYNERIIVVCTSEGTDTAPTPTPVPTSTGEDVADDSGETTSDDEASADEGDLDDDASTVADDEADEVESAEESTDDEAVDDEPVDRGSRGGRTPGPESPDDDPDPGGDASGDDDPDGDSTQDSGTTDEETGAVFGAGDDNGTDTPSDTTSADEATVDIDETGQTASDSRIGGTSSGPGVLPVAAGFALLAGVGAAFRLAVRRENSSSPAKR